MSKIQFSITQTGPVELTTNLGDDPAFKVPVEIVSDNSEFNEAVKNVEEIYYHASEGWKPIIDDDEVSVYDLLGDKLTEIDDNIEQKLCMAIDQFGNNALGNLFRMAEAMWDFLNDNDSLKPAHFDSDVIEQMLNR